MGHPSASVSSAQAPTAKAYSGRAPDALAHRIWPFAAIVLGVGLTVAWAGLLAFGLIKLIEFTL